MKTSTIDWDQLLRITTPLAVFVVVVLYFFLRKIVVQFSQLWRQVQLSHKAHELRNRPKQSAGQNAPVVTRKTDLVDQLGKHEKKLYAYAEHLAAHKQVIEAAKIFESIQFQRRAIDLLENHGMIAEAASVLMRMKLPNRAAVLYERNHRLKEATDHFLMAGDQAAAARVFIKMAQSDFRYLKQAAECFYKAGMMEQCLHCYRNLALPQDILKICLQTQKFEYLLDFMNLPTYVNEILPKLDQEKLGQLLDHTTLNPHYAGLMAFWLSCHLRIDLLVTVLQKLSADRECRHVFWQRLTPRMLNLICQLLAKHPSLLTSELYRLHAETILTIGHRDPGQYFNQLADFNEKIKQSG